MPAGSGSAQSVLDWETAPPPPRQRVPVGAPVAEVPREMVETVVMPSPVTVDTQMPSASSPPSGSGSATGQPPENLLTSHRGLGSRRALYYRVGQTRQLLWAWQKAGVYLNRTTRLVTRPAEAMELIHQMQVIRDVVRNFPPLLGEAGQPGYLVVTLARQQLVVPTLQTLLPSQREALARDWQAGEALLKAHRQFLRQELRAMRRQSAWGRTMRTCWAGINDHPGLLLLAVALVALFSNEVLTNPNGEHWKMWLGAMLGLVLILGLRIAWWWASLHHKRMPSRPQPTGKRRPAAKTMIERRPTSSHA